MDVARAAAPEIDRLVLGFNRNVGPRHGARLAELARERGLDTLELLPQLGDFLLAGRLTRDLATLRMRYWPPERVLGRLDELEAKGLVDQQGPDLAATATLQPLLEAIAEAQAEVGAELWSDHDDDVSTATALAGVVAAAASDDHTVAVVHRSLPEPTDPYLLLEHRLVTLRYVRQHDHAEAWSSRGLTAPDVVVMTRLWQGEPVEDDDGPRRLVELDLAEPDPPRLTVSGRELRDAIEVDTDARAQRTFDVLDVGQATSFLESLRRLPSDLD